MAKKKSNNPFKVWGSWIGVLVFIIMYLLSSSVFNCKIDFLGGSGNFPPQCYVTTLYIPLILLGLVIFEPILEDTIAFGLAIFITIIIAFFIGYGIHLLIRKFKK